MRERGYPLPARVAAALVHATPDWSALLACRLVGAAARLRMPPRVGRAAVAAYARLFGVNLKDIDPLALEDGFTSFNDFFTRPMRTGARLIDRSATSIISPSDGTLRELTEVERQTQVMAKGHRFGLSELLADEEVAERFVGGYAATIYLHPRDYHRVHCPSDALVHRVTLVPGRLLPVFDASVAREPRLFAVNERMIHLLETGMGWMAVVMVAAFGVGNMSCSYDQFEPHARELQVHHREPPARLHKGDELGVFHLGSTVIVLVEGTVKIADAVRLGPVLLGQPLFEERKP